MIDRRYHRSLQLFSWVACAAMTVKLVLFTEYGHRRRYAPAGDADGDSGDRSEPPPHAFTAIQKYADRKLDEFFGVDALQAPPDSQPPSASDRRDQE